VSSTTTLVNSLVQTDDPVVTATNVSAATSTYIGPVTIMTGDNQSQAFTLLTGQVDYDTLITSLVHQTVTTTTTTTNLTRAVYELVGTAAATGGSLYLSTLADGSVTTGAILNVSGSVAAMNGNQGLTVNGAAVPVLADGTFSWPLELAAGSNPVTVVATDKAGIITTDTRTVTLDATAPLITVTAPADNSVTTNGSVTFSGSIGAAGNVVTCTINGGAPQPVLMNGTAFTAVVTLQPGLNTIRGTVTDPANHTGSVKQTITYDAAALSLAITDPDQDSTTALNSLTLHGTVSGAPATVTITMGDQTFTPAVTNGAFQQQLTFPGYSRYAVAVTAADQTGHSGRVQRNIIYQLLKGDINRDGAVTAVDALLALRIAVGLDAGTTTDITIGDMNSNGEITAVDALLILRKAVGL
jgi:hypothetical protein